MTHLQNVLSNNYLFYVFWGGKISRVHTWTRGWNAWYAKVASRRMVVYV